MTDAARHRLVLVRHSKASHDARSDAARSLTRRGHEMAEELAAELAEKFGSVDVLLVSPAVRTKETARPLRDALAPREVRVEDAIYAGSAEDLVALAAASPEEAGTVMIVGHEPWISTTGVILHRGYEEGALEGEEVPEPSRQIYQRASFGVPTATALVLELPGTWAELEQTGALLQSMITIPA